MCKFLRLAKWIEIVCIKVEAKMQWKANRLHNREMHILQQPLQPLERCRLHFSCLSTVENNEWPPNNWFYLSRNIVFAYMCALKRLVESFSELKSVCCLNNTIEDVIIYQFSWYWMVDIAEITTPHTPTRITPTQMNSTVMLEQISCTLS